VKEEVTEAPPLDLDTSDPLMTHGLYVVHNQEAAGKKINNFLIDDTSSQEKTDSEGKLTFELSLEDKEFFEDTRKLGQKLLEEIENYEQCQQLSDTVASSLI
jgi:hypothetical protein